MNKSLSTFFYSVLILCISISIVSCKSSKNRKSKETLETKVIRSCRSFTGTPYRFGGTTRAGMDCSGLLYTSYQLNNVKIPRTSKDQSNFGKKINAKKIQEGDWVFFATGKRKRKITHVGLVTEVRSKKDIQFIHASTKLGVVENSLYSNYYKDVFVKAVRPFE